MMEIRRATYGAAIRLAVVLSAVASLVALGLEAVGDVSTLNLVIVVAIVGFTTSWVQTGRVTRSVTASSSHRVTVVRTHHTIG